MEFEKGVSSFKAFSQLYDSNLEIKELCSKLIRSSKIIKKVMSSRAKFWMRLQMIKYIEALNRNLQTDTLVRWKSIRKENIWTDFYILRNIAEFICLSINWYFGHENPIRRTLAMREDLFFRFSTYLKLPWVLLLIRVRSIRWGS